MKRLKKGVGLVFIILTLLLPIVHSAQVIEVVETKPAPQSNFMGSAVNFLKSSFFKWFIILFVVVVVVGIALFFLIKWLVQFIKLRTDIFWKLKSKRVQLAKVHRTYPSTKYFKFKKNTPIRLVRRTQEGKVKISNPIAYHKGDFTTHEGNMVISFNMIGNSHFFIFPKVELLVIPNKESVTVAQKNKLGKKANKIIDNLPNAKDIIQFNENEILLYAEGISNTGMFFIPVLKSKDGKIIDLSMPTYESLKEVVVGDYLYEQTDEFSKVAKKSMDLNPNLRYATKVADTSQTVEVPSGEK